MASENGPLGHRLGARNRSHLDRRARASCKEYNEVAGSRWQGEVRAIRVSLLRRDINQQSQSACTSLFDVVVEGVMRDVTVKDPLSWLSRRPNHVPSLARPDIDYVGLKARHRIE